MKTIIATILALIACASLTQGFTPSFSLSRPTLGLSMTGEAGQNQEGWKGQRGGQDKHDEMWEAQQELLKSRREHSGSKEERMDKYSNPDVDHHEELKNPWSKSNDKDDHYSQNGQL
jgi:hypothetical protein|uniref:Uncharacterized protein n=1 Tax=Phaeodactylum tricornutum TaxID=2850 RepID=A0A8J9TRN6_PHATR